MPDREKVIKGLKHCSATWMCNGCPYEDDSTDDCKMYEDAIALLREQDETRLVRHYSRPGVYADLWLHCEKCGFCVDDRYRYKHCPECGRKVKWDE